MFFNTFMSLQGNYAGICVRDPAMKRLETTCFRGVDQQLAGNFFRWNTIYGFLYDDLWRGQLVSWLDEFCAKHDCRGTHRLCVDYPEPVGWMSTDVREKYQLEDLEKFEPNRRSWGLRVKPARTDLLAPQSWQVTVVFELKKERGRPTAIIHSVYPGYDIGELSGDVTEREEVVFFGREHQGAQ